MCQQECGASYISGTAEDRRVPVPDDLAGLNAVPASYRSSNSHAGQRRYCERQATTCATRNRQWRGRGWVSRQCNHNGRSGRDDQKLWRESSFRWQPLRRFVPRFHGQKWEPLHCVRPGHPLKGARSQPRSSIKVFDVGIVLPFDERACHVVFELEPAGDQPLRQNVGGEP